LNLTLKSVLRPSVRSVSTRAAGHACSAGTTHAHTRSALSQAETLSQARTHDRYARAYRDAGLCSGCAYQAAYGHQLGFGVVRPPCEGCAATVASLPSGKANGWRALILSAYGKSADLPSTQTAGQADGAGSGDVHSEAVTAARLGGAA